MKYNASICSRDTETPYGAVSEDDGHRSTSNFVVVRLLMDLLIPVHNLVLNLLQSRKEYG